MADISKEVGVVAEGVDWMQSVDIWITRKDEQVNGALSICIKNRHKRRIVLKNGSLGID